MTERITPAEFLEAFGVDDWRVVSGVACAYFATGSFRAGVALVDAIGVLADVANHHPDVDLRYPSVVVRLMTHDVDGLSSRDVELARQISAAARDLGVRDNYKVADAPVRWWDQLPASGAPAVVVRVTFWVSALAGVLEAVAAAASARADIR